MLMIDVVNKLQQHATELSYSASGITVGAGMWVWLGKNAAQIGALCALGGLALAFATFLLNWYYKHKASR